MSNSANLVFFGGNDPFKKDDVQQKQLLQDLGLLQKPPTYSICEKYMVEMSWNAFMSKSGASFEKVLFSTKVVPQFGGKDKTRICFAKTYIYYFVITSIDLWMLKITHDIFALVTKISLGLIGNQNISQ